MAGAALAAAPSCESEARAWRGSAKSPERAALEKCAVRLAATPAGSAARLAMAVAAIEAQRFAEAQPILQRIRGPLLGRIDDYLAFFQASTLAGLSQHAEAVAALEPVWRQQPVSPVTGRAALLAAKSFLAMGRAAEAARLLEKYESQLAQPQGDYVRRRRGWRREIAGKRESIFRACISGIRNRPRLERSALNGGGRGVRPITGCVRTGAERDRRRRCGRNCRRPRRAGHRKTASWRK